MLRRLTFAVMFIVAGFIAGLVVTGRMRSAAESEARVAPRTAHPAPRTSPDAAPQAATPIQPTAVSSGGPDFTRVAGLAVKGVANISSLEVVRTRNTPFPNDPFFRYFFGDDDQFTRDRRSM